jgi:hypothetical protein
MRPKAVFAALTLPAALLAGVTMWGHAEASGWTPAAGELSLPVRAALALDNWVIRLLPFAMIPVALLWPVIVWGLESITGAASHRNSATRADVVGWWAASGSLFLAVGIASAVLFFYRPTVEVPAAALACVAWVGIVAFWLSLAAAFGVQQKRYASRESAWTSGRLLVGVGALNCVGLFALPLLAFIAFRQGESRSADGAVEQGDEADKP